MNKKHAFYVYKQRRLNMNIKNGMDVLQRLEEEKNKNILTVENYAETDEIQKEEPSLQEAIEETQKMIPAEIIPVEKQVRKRLYLVITEGLCNRLHIIASAYSIAKETGRFLVVYWKKNTACHVLFSDIFTHSFDCLAFTESIEFVKEDDVYVYNYMVCERYIDESIDKDILVKSNKRLKNKNVNASNELEFFRGLKPVFRVQKFIERFDFSGKNVVGLHVREEKGEEHTKKRYKDQRAWDASSDAKKYYWRYRSHLNRFISEINYHINLDPSAVFYIATDTPENYDTLSRMYGERIIFNRKKEYNDKVDEMIYAIADIYILASCRYLIGSHMSSFTQMALLLHGSKNTKTSKDFRMDDDEDKNILGEARVKGNSIVTVSRDMNQELIKAVDSWLDVEECDEIIILDWSSSTPVSEVIKTRDPRVLIYRIEDEPRWIPSHAYNLAISLTSKTNIYKLSPLHRVANNKLIVNNPLTKDIYYTGVYNKENEYAKQTIDAMFIRYRTLADMNFHNENILGAAWYDEDKLVKFDR